MEESYLFFDGRHIEVDPLNGESISSCEIRSVRRCYGTSLAVPATDRKPYETFQWYLGCVLSRL